MWASAISAILQLGSCITPKKGPRRAFAAAQKMQPFDAIIVPGIPFKNGSWDSVMKARLLWAMVIYKQGLAKNVIFSGDAVYSPYKEAYIMGLYAQKLGIRKEHIYYDTLARHSTENLYYSYLLAKKLGFKSLAVATDPFQAGLLKSFIRRRFGTPIYRLPFVTDTLAAYNHLDPVLDRSEYRQLKQKDFISITEKEGFWRRFRGTLGRDIDWSKHKDGKLEAL
jgi:hypothetical protein